MTLEETKADLIAGDCNKNEQMMVLIAELIASGVQDRSTIVQKIAALGYNPTAVGIQLVKNADTKTSRKEWYKDSDGLYQLHT